MNGYAREETGRLGRRDGGMGEVEVRPQSGSVYSVLKKQKTKNKTLKGPHEKPTDTDT